MREQAPQSEASFTTNIRPPTLHTGSVSLNPRQASPSLNSSGVRPSPSSSITCGSPASPFEEANVPGLPRGDGQQLTPYPYSSGGSPSAFNEWLAHKPSPSPEVDGRTLNWLNPTGYSNDGAYAPKIDPLLLLAPALWGALAPLDLSYSTYCRIMKS